MNEKYVISAIEKGIIPDTNEDLSGKIIDLILENKENSKIIFAPGNYFIKKRIDANMRQFFFGFMVKLYIILLITITRDMSKQQRRFNFERLFIRCYATTRTWFVSVRITNWKRKDF